MKKFIHIILIFIFFTSCNVSNIDLLPSYYNVKYKNRITTTGYKAKIYTFSNNINLNKIKEFPIENTFFSKIYIYNNSQKWIRFKDLSKNEREFIKKRLIFLNSDNKNSQISELINNLYSKYIYFAGFSKQIKNNNNYWLFYFLNDNKKIIYSFEIEY